MTDEIKHAARILSGAENVVALTGAGISVESGIPPFRGKGGLWERIDPMKYAHIDAFMEDPGDVWRVLIRGMQVLLQKARPNPAHTGLADLERMGILKTVITQNVDGLHQLAGSSDVIEFHGTFATLRCLACQQRFESLAIDLAEMPPLCGCGGILRPDCIFFGEMIPQQALYRSQHASANCDAMLVIGTSATVQPAATLPIIARDNGAEIIEINAEPTPFSGRLSHLTLLGSAAHTVTRLVAAVERYQPPP